MSIVNSHVDRTEQGGQFTDVISVKAKNYQGNGAWRVITNSLGASGDPSYPIGVDELVQFRIDPRLAGKSPLWTFGKGQSRVSIACLGANNREGAVSGNTITFPEAWDNADLRLSIGGHRLEDDILLKTGHPSAFSFRLDENIGLSVDTLSCADFRILDPVLYNPVTGVIIPLTWVKSVQGGKLILTVTLPAGDYAGWVLDPTLTLQPDATDGKDSFMRSSQPTINRGTTNVINAGEISGNTITDRFLYEANLTSIAPTATVQAATLSLWLASAGTTYALNNRVLSLYRILRSWVEAEATWNEASTGVNWGTAGCANTTSDRESGAIGSKAIATTDASGSQHDFSLTASLVQEWISGTLTNKGLVGVMATEVDDLYSFHSSDGTTANLRPSLAITYTLPAATSGGFFPVLARMRRRGRL